MLESASKKTTRLTVEVPIEFHRALKTFVSAHRLSIKDYIVSKLTEDMINEQEYDCDNLNDIVKNGLKEISLAQQGKLNLKKL